MDTEGILLLITLEGIDGSGKSTLHENLRTILADLDPLFTREPGATWVGDQVRRAIAEQIDPITEATLFVADHAAHLAKVSGRYSQPGGSSFPTGQQRQPVRVPVRNPARNYPGPGRLASGNAQRLDDSSGIRPSSVFYL